jgi:hypothetical protein
MNLIEVIDHQGTEGARLVPPDSVTVLAVTADQYALIMSALDFLSTESEIRTAYREGSKYSDCDLYAEVYRQVLAATGREPAYPGMEDY